MPIYEYRCRTCDHAFQHLHRRLGESTPPCPGCGGSDVKKLLSTFSAAVGRKPDLSACASGACASGACPARGCPTGGCPLN